MALEVEFPPIPKELVGVRPIIGDPEQIRLCRRYEAECNRILEEAEEAAEKGMNLYRVFLSIDYDYDVEVCAASEKEAEELALEEDVHGHYFEPTAYKVDRISRRREGP